MASLFKKLWPFLLPHVIRWFQNRKNRGNRRSY